MAPKICVVVGYGASMAPALSNVIGEEGVEGVVRTPATVRVSDLKGVGAVLIYASTLPKDVEAELERLSRGGGAAVVGVDESHASLTNVDLGVALALSKYLKLGGVENLRALVRALASLASGRPPELPEPRELPLQGIYHPRHGVFESLGDYLRVYEFASRPLVGILFYRSDWVYGKTSVVDALVEELENLGLGVIPVFTYGFKDDVIGSEGKEESIRRFFFRSGRPVIEVLVNLTSFFMSSRRARDAWSSREVASDEGTDLLKALGVPVLQGIRVFGRSAGEWLESKEGVDYSTLTYSVTMPEVNGVVEPVVVAGTSLGPLGEKRYEVVREHVSWIARRVRRWVDLRLKPPSERRVAIVLINPPCKGVEANVAVGMGLDVPESVVRFLRFLREEGYDVGGELPASGEELIKLILTRKALSEFRWTPVEEIVSRGGALGFVSKDEYLRWFSELPGRVRDEMVREWGDPREVLEGRAPKELTGMVWGGRFVVPGLRFGNVVVLPQPKRGCAGPRCDGRVCKILHNPKIPPPHQWLAVYRWLTRVFRADVIIHFGTHGYLEFLPGKGVGLSWMCWPEISVDDVPHLYVYVVANPMEGSMAKRRGYAVIVDHLYPPLEQCRVFEDLEALLKQLLRAREVGDRARAEVLERDVVRRAREAGIPLEGCDDPVERIKSYVEMVGNTAVNAGLHILGAPPEDPKLLAEYVVSTLTARVGGRPSITEVLESIVGGVDAVGRAGIRRAAVRLVERLLRSGGVRDACGEAVKALEGEGFEVRFCGEVEERALRSVLRVAARVAELIMECRRELRALASGVAGRFIEPGASGALTRGRFEILPTGRNFFLVDPRALPTRAAWVVGVESARRLLQHYRNKYGRYPESVGEVLWSIDAFKADGEQLAQILYLLGVRPVWSDAGTVVGVEPIPIEELGRPRIDVVVRISGIVRDVLPNYVELIDKAVALVLSLDEPPEVNYVRKHFLTLVKELGGGGAAEELASYRVFGPPPGAYGAGVNLAVEASAWRGREDLAKVWIQWGGYAYGVRARGVKAVEPLVRNLRFVDVVTKNSVSDEHDILGCCCYFGYHGGFVNAVRVVKGGPVEGVVVDTRDPAEPVVRDLEVEVDRVVLSKLLNPAWVSRMREHGYRGASELQRKVLHLYGWGASAGVVRDEWFERIARKYVLDREMREWFMKHNVWALEEITRRLVEAAERGVWRARPETLEGLKQVYSEIEGVLEDELTAGGEVQGGSIDIVAPEDVGEWGEALKEVEEALRSLRSLPAGQHG